MFEHFIQSKIPVLGVHTDDVLNFQTALQLIAKRKVVPWPTLKTAQANLGPYLYWTDDLEVVTVEAVKKLKQNELQLVVINPEKTSDLVRDAGLLPYPESMIREYLEDFVQEAELPALLMVLRGLSLRVAEEITQITMARTGGLLPQELRRTRTLLSGSLQGLYTVDTELEFYQQPQEVGEWLKINSQYFMSPKTPQMLMPRGLMFSGSPGVGKSMASKAIAAHFGIPLFRLDISTTLNKYIGESEARVGRSLSMVEREGPCVLPQTRIRTTEGELTAEELHARHLQEQFYLKGIDPQTGNPCIMKLHTMIKREGKPSVRVQTSTGVLECTKEHKLLVNRNGVNEWVEAQYLVEGDDLVEV